MQNRDVQKHPRGSSGLQASESRAESVITGTVVKRGIRSGTLPTDASEPVLDARIAVVRSAQGRLEDSTRKDHLEESNPGDHSADILPDAQRGLSSLRRSVWQDEGGESGAEV